MCCIVAATGTARTQATSNVVRASIRFHRIESGPPGDHPSAGPDNRCDSHAPGRQQFQWQGALTTSCLSPARSAIYEPSIKRIMREASGYCGVCAVCAGFLVADIKAAVRAGDDARFHPFLASLHVAGQSASADDLTAPSATWRPGFAR